MSDTSKRLEILYELKRYEELLRISPALIASHDDSFSAHHYTILALIALERLDEALTSCHLARAHFPSQMHFLYLNTFIVFTQNHVKQALTLMHELLAHEPNVAIYHHLHAQILVALSLYTEAKRAIDKALQHDSHDADFLMTLSIITYHLGNTPIACEILHAILAQEPHNPQALHLQSTLCSATLFEKRQILKSILYRNPFNKEGKEDLKSIERYYHIAPVLMMTFLFYALGEYWEMWEKSLYTPKVLLLLSFYVWRDWRLSLPFFALCFSLLGDVSWHEWYVIPLGALLYFIVGKIGWQLGTRFFDKIGEIFQKGKRWMNR